MEPLLPREVEDALPADPKLQLQLALRLASRAFSARDASCSQEVSRLRAQLAARDGAAAALEERAARAEAAAARARDESRTLAGEVRRLRAEVAKAEGVRRSLLRSLGEGQEGGGGGGGGGGFDDNDVGVGSVGVGSVGVGSVGVGSVGVGGGVYGAVERAAPSASSYDDDGYATPAAAAVFAGAATAAKTGLGGFVGGEEAATTAGTIPASWKKQAPTTTTTTATTATTTTSTKMMSGKDFFRQARARLAPARFDALMGIVRSLNGGRSSRAAALRAAAETLGGEGGGCADLVPVFEGLLSQRVPVD